MKKISILLLSLSITITALSQKNGAISGRAFDTLAKQSITSATVTVLDQKDSSLVTFTLTDNSGKFELKGIPNGKYRLLLSHVSYHNSNTLFSITDSIKNVEAGDISMNDLKTVLGEVVISNEAPPVTLVGDTVQYNAGSFKVIPNANVEQLLKKLPGVQVDKDGKITAQGEKVARVLVDGKEFFGNDPKIATRNLPADAVDKVQVYDKQSDQAQLTGFDDGNYEKTINLKLKKDMKKGLFGKVAAGGGDDGRYEGRFNVNSFKGARQMSAIGMGNNTNAEGFSFLDILNFTGALSQMRQNASGGTLNLSVTAEDAAALGMGGRNSGINTTFGGGLNYNDIIGKNLDFQSNYFYNRFNPNVQSKLLRQNIIQGVNNFYNEEAYSDNLNNSHRFNMNMLFQLDSMHTLRVVPSLSYQKTNNNSSRRYSTMRENNEMINDGYSNNVSNSEGYNFRNDITFRKKFKRRGRTFSFTLGTSINASDGEGDLMSVVNFYNAGNIIRRDTINQRNDNNADLKGYNTRAIYTEPLWKRTMLEFSAGNSNSRNNAQKNTYDYNRNNGKFDQVNDLLTNDFQNTYGNSTLGFRMKKQSRKFNYSAGFTWQYAQLEGKVISGSKDSVITKSFKNLLPTASFRYNFSKFKSATIYYSASTNQPTVSQLQPVPDNTNPLYLREGNPELKQEYNHSLRANVNMVSPYKNKNLFVNIMGSLTNNKIVNYDSVDLATGVRKTKPVNVDGVYNLNSSINYSLPVKFLKGNLQLGSSVGYYKTKQFINTEENVIKTIAIGPEIRLDMNPTEKLNVAVGARLDMNRAKYSLESLQNNNYLSQDYDLSVEWQLPKQFFFATDFNYLINSQRAAGFNTNVPMWNASVSKQFLKYNRGEIKFAARDLLNKNTGITRTANQNYIEDKQVNTIRRFFLLSFTYSLTKSGLNRGGGPGGMRVMRDN